MSLGFSYGKKVNGTVTLKKRETQQRPASNWGREEIENREFYKKETKY